MVFPGIIPIKQTSPPFIRPKLTPEITWSGSAGMNVKTTWSIDKIPTTKYDLKPSFEIADRISSFVAPLRNISLNTL